MPAGFCICVCVYLCMYLCVCVCVCVCVCGVCEGARVRAYACARVSKYVANSHCNRFMFPHFVSRGTCTVHARGTVIRHIRNICWHFIVVEWYSA